MGPEVAFEVHLLGETLSAVPADEGPLTGVDKAMPDEVTASRERLAAELAKILGAEDTGSQTRARQNAAVRRLRVVPKLWRDLSF